jgi:hypothetical protein
MTRRWEGRWGIINPVIKRVGPDGQIHEGWCPIFLCEDCDCYPDDNGDGDDGDTSPRKDDGGSKIKTPNKRERELA